LRFEALHWPYILVFQNEILHVARQDPLQLCALFERVSGSMKLKGQYEEKKRIKRQAEEKHAEEAEQRSALAKRKGAIKAQKEEAEKYQQCQKEQVLFPFFAVAFYRLIFFF
jgi:chromosome segregation ATPase